MMVLTELLTHEDKPVTAALGGRCERLGVQKQETTDETTADRKEKKVTQV